MKSIGVLGCGPTGLLVAYAVEQAGHVPHIISEKKKSIIPGSQHLHGPVPGLTSEYPEGTIQFVRIGTAEEYARKVYGDRLRETGWENYLQVYPSWNVIRLYDQLWERYEDEISDLIIDSSDIPHLLEMYDAVISTIPAWKICNVPELHTFDGQEYWIKRLPTPEADKDHEIVVYNGLRSDHWYRWSILGGLCSIETTSWMDTGDPGWEKGTKAVGNDCDCWPTVHRCGRWAEWTHGITVYKSYLKATQIMEGLNDRTEQPEHHPATR
jgi:hypothetical protein